MSYADADTKRSAKPIVAVALVHAAIAYAFVSGLAIKIAPWVDHPTTVEQISDPQPPPEREIVPPKSTVRRTAAPTDTFLPPVRTVDPQPSGEVFVVPTQSFGSGETGADPSPQQETLSSRPSLARGAEAIGSRGAWVTTDDYPPAALRAGSEGIVGIALAIGADGRVTDCRVTQSSGNALLDAATCRVYPRRARFRPALDEAGQPVAAMRNDRVLWQLPPE